MDSKSYEEGRLDESRRHLNELEALHGHIGQLVEVQRHLNRVLEEDNQRKQAKLDEIEAAIRIRS